MTYQEAYQEGERTLREAGIADSASDAMLLLTHVGGPDRTHYLLERADCMPQQILDAYLTAIHTRAARIPLQHITGEAYFCGYRFKVSEQVLIPRQDTELLVREALRMLEDIPGSPRVLDLCTGSGCIIISMKELRPAVRAFASDISRGALQIAEENAAALGCEVTFFESDLFNDLPLPDPGDQISDRDGRYDLIVSNPPYIAAGEIGTLEEEVRGHDPYLALCGGRDGLDFYRRIAAKAPVYLTCRGMIALEIGYDQKDAVSALLAEEGFTDIRCLQDLSGLDRVVCARYPG